MIAGISVAISVSALGFSFYVFFESRRRDRRDIFLTMHQLMIGDDPARGRYLLFQKVTDADSIAQLTDEEYRNINRALATYNALGLYVSNGYVRERDVMDMWAQPICRAWYAAQPFISHRESFQGYRPWKYFELLAQRAEKELSRSGVTLELKVWRRTEKPQPGTTTSSDHPS
jgi:hypothetical protein